MQRILSPCPLMPVHRHQGLHLMCYRLCMLLILATASLFSISAQARGPSFEKWLPALAESDGLRITNWGLTDLDGDGKNDEKFAFLCGPKPGPASWYVVEEDGRRWVMEFERACSPIAIVPDFDLVLPAVARVTVYQGSATFSAMVAPVGGQLEVVHESWASGGWTADSGSIDWINLRRIRQWSDYGNEGEVIQTSETAVAVIGPPGLAPPNSKVSRLLGDGESKKDSEGVELTVAASQVDAQHIDIYVSVKDDQPVRTAMRPLRHELEQLEHLEVIWCPKTQACDKTRRKLGIGIPESGPAHRQWLQDVADDTVTLPDVESGGDGTVRVRVPLTQLAGKGTSEDWQTPFTVVYADRTDPDKGIEARIATSDLRSADELSLGLMVRFPDHRRYPTYAKRIQQNLRILDSRELKPKARTLRQAAGSPGE
ncbi:MAG: hypothetical protein AAGA48_04475 [Myxococcota bacterium]